MKRDRKIENPTSNFHLGILPSSSYLCIGSISAISPKFFVFATGVPGSFKKAIHIFFGGSSLLLTHGRAFAYFGSSRVLMKRKKLVFYERLF